MDKIVKFAKKYEKENDVVTVVHCAYGIGRSTCAMCAILIGSGIAEDGNDALKLIRRHRKIARLNYRMTKSINEWLVKYHVNNKKKN